MAEMTRLRTGEEVQTVLLLTVTQSMELLMTANPVALYELVMWARDRSHQPFGNTGEILRDLGLLHDSVRPIVLASVTGDDPDVTFCDPVAAQRGLTEQ